MYDDWRIRRQAELRDLKSANPQELLRLYAATGQSVGQEIPAGIGFLGMIEAILKHEGGQYDANGQKAS